MNLKFIGIGAVVIAVVTVACFAAYYAIENEWFTPWDGNDDVDGTWKEEVIITYADGTTDSLKLLIDQNPLAIEYQGKEITEIEYRLSGESTGEGYETCHIDFTDFQIDALVNAGAHSIYDMVWGYSSPSMNLPVNGGNVFILSIPLEIEDILSGEPAGVYNVAFVPCGTVMFRGEASNDVGEWFSATLPSAHYLWVDKVAGIITLDFTSTVDAN